MTPRVYNQVFNLKRTIIHPLKIDYYNLKRLKRFANFKLSIEQLLINYYNIYIIVFEVIIILYKISVFLT